MTELSFVNIHGDPVGIVAEKAKRQAKPKDAHHDGWLATGVSPQAIERAKDKAKVARKDFDLVAFLRSAKREKIRTKPYFSAAVAKEACDLAERAGWQNCYPIERKVD